MPMASGSLASFTPDGEQLLLFNDARAAWLSHRLFKGSLPREQFKKLVD